MGKETRFLASLDFSPVDTAADCMPCSVQGAFSVCLTYVTVHVTMTKLTAREARASAPIIGGEFKLLAVPLRETHAAIHTI